MSPTVIYRQSVFGRKQFQSCLSQKYSANPPLKEVKCPVAQKESKSFCKIRRSNTNSKSLETCRRGEK